jgi:Glutaredoxin-like domain (DUF836).
MPALILYTTLGCHLCEQAQTIIARTQATFKLIDIADDETLVETYGVRIPVVKNSANGKEIGWPFNQLEFQRWLKTP